MSHPWFVLVDLLGTFAFALSGASASVEARLDAFGVVVVAYVTACGGGILRDLCLGAVPPAAISLWRYAAVALIAATLAAWPHSLVRRLKQPVLVFDAVGLGFFAVTGAQKALLMSANVEVAILLGVATAVGGGLLRDVLLNRVPVVLQREIYASAALLGAAVEVFGQLHGWEPALALWLGAASCALLRFLALWRHWRLPVPGGRA